MSEHEVFFTGTYTYRKTSVAIISACLLLIFIPASWHLGWQASAFVSSPQKLFFALMIACFLAFFIWVGLALGYSFISKKAIQHTISRAGVSHAGRLVSWEKVDRLLATLQHDRCQLLLLYPGRLARNHHLMVDEGLSQAEYMALMKMLQEQVAPHVRFG